MAVISYRDKDWLYDNYINKKLTSVEIAEKCSCDISTVCNWLRRYNISTRPSYMAGNSCNSYRAYVDRDWLEWAYSNQKLSMAEIGKICGAGTTTIMEWLRKHNIVIRNHTEATLIAFGKYEHPRWQNGKSFEPYCPLFDDEIKEKIRNQDNRTCVLCGKSEILNGRRLAVHHIDGDKMQGCDNKKWYLCSLCMVCHKKIDVVKNEFLLIARIGGYYFG